MFNVVLFTHEGDEAVRVISFSISEEEALSKVFKIAL